MSLSAGTRIGPYEILTLVGSGGMGEVYRARDAKLGRDIAIKVLPNAVADDPERLARFEREARVLAALNHPNIAHIHGFEDSTGAPAIVMELVEGPTLADRIARGPIPMDEAFAIARQIAEALEAAHEQGIIHRDLKPANIKLRDGGTVKVLDFGLAKAMEPAGAMSVDLSMSPTITTPAMTQAGVILGTAAYMAPEQAKGRPADRRSDVWAFGCVLYEMLTGALAFHAADVTETIAYVLTREPDWSALPSNTTAAVRRLLRRCLEKDRNRRLHDIGDARIELEEPRSDGDSEDRQKERRSTAGGRWFSPLAVAGLVVAVAIASAAGAWYVALRDMPRPRPLKRFAIDMRTTPLNASQLATSFALSPDGTKLVYSSGSYEGSQLYVQAFDQRDPKLLPGTTWDDVRVRPVLFHRRPVDRFLDSNGTQESARLWRSHQTTHLGKPGVGRSKLELRRDHHFRAGRDEWLMEGFRRRRQPTIHHRTRCRAERNRSCLARRVARWEGGSVHGSYVNGT
jgi:serine/threonine protein kinase